MRVPHLCAVRKGGVVIHSRWVLRARPEGANAGLFPRHHCLKSNSSTDGTVPTKNRKAPTFQKAKHGAPPNLTLLWQSHLKLTSVIVHSTNPFGVELLKRALESITPEVAPFDVLGIFREAPVRFSWSAL
jgi:hypothetical protein